MRAMQYRLPISGIKNGSNGFSEKQPNIWDKKTHEAIFSVYVPLFENFLWCHFFDIHGFMRCLRGSNKY
jgi:hypothetical protein